MTTNKEIRNAAKEKGVRLWEIAEHIGINDGNFSRKMRHELSDEMKDHVLNVINEIAASREDG